MWRSDFLDITEDYTLSEKEKKRIVLSCISDKYKDMCHHLYHNDKNLKTEEFIDKIKNSLDFDNMSSQCLRKLQNIRVGNRTVNDYNMQFSLLLREVEEDVKPSEKVTLRMYIDGFKGKMIQDYLIIRDPKKFEGRYGICGKTTKRFFRI